MRSRWTGPEALAPRQLPNEACYTSERHDDGFLCDCFNPGIGCTSNSSTGAMISTASFMTTGVPAEPTAWKVHTTGLPSRGPRCKGLVSRFRLYRRVLGNDHPHLGYPTPLTWLEVKLPAELEDPSHPLRRMPSGQPWTSPSWTYYWRASCLRCRNLLRLRSDLRIHRIRQRPYSRSAAMCILSRRSLRPQKSLLQPLRAGRTRLLL
jgi:hypothetical protein